MKKITLMVSALCLTLGASAQLFTDNFDAYNSGDYLGVVGAPDWTTWSGTTGGAEDVQVGTAQASSGTNSIYFAGSAGGGPQDVVLDFGQQFVDGMFTFETDLYIEAGKGGYFNFQATPVIGTTWAMNCTMSSEMLSIDDGVTGDLALGAYTDATWFTLRIEANLSTGRWQAFIDGVCIGVWANSINELASLDLFPLDGDGFYVDDIMYDWSAYTASSLNAAVGAFDIGGNIAGLNVTPTVNVVNAGTTAISSFDVTVDYNGNQYVENVTGQNLTAGQNYNVVYTTSIPLVAGSNPATATVSNVNGGADDDATDDDGCLISNPVTPAAGKVVVGEEATGTWCGWCPRGAVFMDQFAADFGPYWAGIAVHNGDPMTDATYDAGIGGLIGGYPSALVDRGGDIDPSAMTTDFYARLQTAPTALMSNSATFNSSTNELTVTVSADFQAAAGSTWKLACVLTEDNVTGSDAGYSQANYYAGGGSGIMGGYEILPDPVPFGQMVYDHVARGIMPSFDGDNTVFPATVNASEVHSGTYTFTIDPSWDMNQMHVVGMLIAPNGTVDNAGQSTLGDLLDIDEVTNPIQSFNVYPNPSTTYAVVTVDLKQESDVVMTIVDMTGKKISSKDYGTMIDHNEIPMNTSSLETGVYLVQLTVNNFTMTKRLVVE